MKKIEKKKSEFETWFVAQFGPRPKRVSGSFGQMMYYIFEAEKWDLRHDAALKAWCARDKKAGAK